MWAGLDLVLDLESIGKGTRGRDLGAREGLCR